MDKKEEYVVHEEKIYTLCLIIMSIVAICLGYWALTLSPDDSVFEHRDVSFVHFISVSVIITFLIGLIIFIKRYIGLTKNNKILVLTEKGIECNNPGMEYTGWIGWEEIVDIAVEKDGDYKVVKVCFTDKNRELEKTREKRIKTVFKEKDGMHIAKVLLSETDRDIDEIKEKVEEYWGKYGRGKEQKRIFEENIVGKEEKLMKEKEQTKEDLVEGLLEAADDKKCNELQQFIEIKRNEKTFLNLRFIH